LFKDKIVKKYLPLTESSYYILLSLVEIRHGYGIMQYVEEITNNRLKIGPGTLYGALSKMEKEELIEMELDSEKKKSYALTTKGKKDLYGEIQRLKELISNGEEIIKKDGGINSGLFE